MLRKLNKSDYTVVKSYWVIRFLNCLSNVFENVVGDIPANWCEVNHILHDVQMGSRQQLSTINIVVRVIGWV